MSTQTKRMYCPDDERWVLAERKSPNHILHLLLSVLTAGLWLVVWLLLIVVSAPREYKCPVCGQVTLANAPKGRQQKAVRT